MTELDYFDTLIKSRFTEMFGDIKQSPYPFKRGYQLFKFSSGKFLEESKRTIDGIPVYGGNGISWYTDTPLLTSPTIVIGRVGVYCGNVRLVKDPCWVTDNAIYIKSFHTNDLEIEFVKQLMVLMDFHQYSDESAQPKITQKPLEESEYIVPPIELQREFINFCNQVDKSKVIYKEVVSKFDDLIKSRFIEMFGNPLYQTSDYAYAPINSFAKCVAGATPSTAVNEYWEGGDIPWLSSGEVNKGRIYSTEKTITQKGYDNCSTHLVPAHTVLIALAGQGKTRGTVAVAEIALCTNQSICSILTDDSIDTDYLFHALKIQYDRIRSMSNGDGGRGGLNLEIVGKITVPKPPIELQKQFAKFVNQVDKSKSILLDSILNSLKT